MNQVTGAALLFGLVIGVGVFLYEYLTKEEPHSYTTAPRRTSNYQNDPTTNKKKQQKQKQFNCTWCTICLEEFIDGSELTKLSCNHYYHPQCINRWLHQNDNIPACPLCKQKHSSANLITYSSKSS